MFFHFLFLTLNEEQKLCVFGPNGTEEGIKMYSTQTDEAHERLEKDGVGYFIVFFTSTHPTMH